MAGVDFEGRSLGAAPSAAVEVRATAAETPSASRPRRKSFMSTPFGTDPGEWQAVTSIIGALPPPPGRALRNSAAARSDLPKASVVGSGRPHHALREKGVIRIKARGRC